MEHRRGLGSRRFGDSPVDRLLRDLGAFGAPDGRSPARERLAAELGDDLLAAILAELHCLDLGRFSFCTRARRIA